MERGPMAAAKTEAAGIVMPIQAMGQNGGEGKGGNPPSRSLARWSGRSGNRHTNPPGVELHINSLKGRPGIMKSWIGTPLQRNCNLCPTCASCRSPSCPAAPWTLPFHASKMRQWHGVGTPLGVAACGAMTVLRGSAFGSGRQSGDNCGKARAADNGEGPHGSR